MYVFYTFRGVPNFISSLFCEKNYFPIYKNSQKTLLKASNQDMQEVFTFIDLCLIMIYYNYFKQSVGKRFPHRTGVWPIPLNTGKSGKRGRESGEGVRVGWVWEWGGCERLNKTNFVTKRLTSDRNISFFGKNFIGSNL